MSATKTEYRVRQQYPAGVVTVYEPSGPAGKFFADHFRDTLIDQGNDAWIEERTVTEWEKSE